MAFGPISFLGAASAVRSFGSTLGSLLSGARGTTGQTALAPKLFQAVMQLGRQRRPDEPLETQPSESFFREEQVEPGLFGNVALRHLIPELAGTQPLPPPGHDPPARLRLVGEIARAEFGPQPDETVPREILEPIFVPALPPPPAEPPEPLPLPAPSPAPALDFLDVLILNLPGGGPEIPAPYHLSRYPREALR